MIVGTNMRPRPEPATNPYRAIIVDKFSERRLSPNPVPVKRPPVMQTARAPNRLIRVLDKGPRTKVIVPITDPIRDTDEKGASKYCGVNLKIRCGSLASSPYHIGNKPTKNSELHEQEF